MNVDSGNIVPWDSLTTEEKESGRWVKLTEDEHAMAERVPLQDRKDALGEMLRSLPKKEYEDSYEGLRARLKPPEPETGLKHEMEIGDFHETNGWYFKRLADGSVRIRVNGYGEHLLAPFSWCSVIAHVAPGGESVNYRKAEDFHMRPDLIPHPDKPA